MKIETFCENHPGLSYRDRLKVMAIACDAMLYEAMCPEFNALALVPIPVSNVSRR